MPKDCNGREIKIGDTVKHKHESAPRPPGFHNFAGKAKVLELFQEAVRVEQHASTQIPVYCSELVEIVG